MHFFQDAYGVRHMLDHVKQRDGVKGSIGQIGSWQRTVGNIQAQNVPSITTPDGRNFDPLRLPTAFRHAMREKTVAASHIHEFSPVGDTFLDEGSAFLEHLRREPPPCFPSFRICG